jgi:RNA polymerase sigma factor (sigma-70 family)
MGVAVSAIHSDQYIIEGLRTNDNKIVAQLYKDYAPKMLGWLRQHGAQDAEAQDVFQEALIDIFRKASHGDFTLSCPFDAFLFVLVRNKWYTIAKNKHKTVVTDPDELGYRLDTQLSDNVESIMQYEKQHEFLQQKLEELKDGCKEVLKLSWKGMRMEEVAKALNVTYAYVRKKKSLCMAKLVESMQGSPEFTTLSFVQ